MGVEAVSSKFDAAAGALLEYVRAPFERRRKCWVSRASPPGHQFVLQPGYRPGSVTCQSGASSAPPCRCERRRCRASAHRPACWSGVARRSHRLGRDEPRACDNDSAEHLYVIDAHLDVRQRSHRRVDDGGHPRWRYLCSPEGVRVVEHLSEALRATVVPARLPLHRHRIGVRSHRRRRYAPLTGGTIGHAFDRTATPGPRGRHAPRGRVRPKPVSRPSCLRECSQWPARRGALTYRVADSRCCGHSDWAARHTQHTTGSDRLTQGYNRKLWNGAGVRSSAYCPGC